MNILGMHISPALLGAIAVWIGSAAVRALPEPRPMESRFYAWAYQFAHILGANFDKIGK